MSLLSKEKEIKLEILQSLSDCQRTLSRMLENVAAALPQTGLTAQTALELVKSIGKYQHVLGKMLNGIKLQQVKAGEPAAPWVNRSERVSPMTNPHRKTH